MKNQKLRSIIFSLGSLIVITIITLYSCKKESKFENADGDIINLKAPSGEIIGSERSLIFTSLQMLDDPKLKSSDIEITNIEYFNERTGYAAVVYYKTSSGVVKNFVAFKGNLSRVNNSKSIKVIQNVYLQSGESGGSSGGSSGGGTTVYYTCQRNMHELHC